jgi:hypothetical protein
LLGQFGAEEAIGCRLPHDDVVTVDADPGVELAAGGSLLDGDLAQGDAAGRIDRRPLTEPPARVAVHGRVDPVNGGQSTGMT